MARIRDGIVVEDEGTGVRHLWRVVPVDEPREGRAPTEEEMAAGGMGAPPPRGWGLDRRWRPIRANSRRA
jgi:hypothetical protein